MLASWSLLTKIERSWSVSQRYGSPDPDPNQNVTDPQHCFQPSWNRTGIWDGKGTNLLRTILYMKLKKRYTGWHVYSSIKIGFTGLFFSVFKIRFPVSLLDFDLDSESGSWSRQAKMITKKENKSFITSSREWWTLILELGHSIRKLPWSKICFYENF